VLGSAPTMLRARGKNQKGRLARGDIQGDSLGGITEVAFLVASSGHDIPDTGLDELARLVARFLGNEARESEVFVQIEACREALDRDGFDERINAVLRNLPTIPLRRLALDLGAEVLLSDDAFRLEFEGELFLALGITLGFPREEVLLRLREAQLRAASPGE
jgi:hypothetical protein